MLMLDKTNLPSEINKPCLRDDMEVNFILNQDEERENGSMSDESTTLSPSIPSKDGVLMKDAKSPWNALEATAKSGGENWGKSSLAPRKHTPAACKNPASVAKRNARERRRIKSVNLAFDELRQHVPLGEPNKKKISKVDTLQSAIEYIKALEKLLIQKREIKKSTEEKEAVETEVTTMTAGMNNCDETGSNTHDERADGGLQSTPSNDVHEISGFSQTCYATNDSVEEIFENLDIGLQGNVFRRITGSGVDGMSSNDSGYSDSSIPTGDKAHDISRQNVCFVSENISYAPFLGEVTPDEVEHLLDNATAAVDAPVMWTRNCHDSDGAMDFSTSVTNPLPAQYSIYSTLPTDRQGYAAHQPVSSTPRHGSIMCAFANRVTSNDIPSGNHDADEKMRISNAMNNYADSHEGYRFGDAYA